ncbi:MAG: thiamine pyrophosphate-dependent dehydrogenase E1 component subunit alpha [Anaerolineae bacterium]|nr:thiamine pyrophosphate-dependent dehydrogenase E1 component subunit alpha [Anaerolineae bacterium]
MMELDKSLLHRMYYHMRRIRRFEETAEELYKRGTVVGLLHLYIGEEAVATGVCLALREDDYITSTHRGHGHLLAKGGDPKRLLAELCGRLDGYCRGKGGSMHAADLSLGILGANGVVGGGFGIATGAALSAKMRRSGQVAVCFFGDGAANQGIFMEVLNMAAIWKLPVIYVCENNGFGQYTRYEEATVTDQPIGARAAAFGLPTAQVDGNDVIAVYQAAVQAVERARAGHGPSFIEARTYRLRGHHMGDVGFARRYRTKEELEEHMQREPVGRFRRWLLENQVFSEAEIREIEAQVETELQEAIDFVNRSPIPDVSTITEHVYA